MFDKALLDSFNSYFGGSQTQTLLRIKQEVELFGLGEFKEIAFQEIQHGYAGNDDKAKLIEEERIFKNAIFTVINDIVVDEDAAAFQLMVMALENWINSFERSFDEFGIRGLTALNDLLNESFYYAHGDLEFDYNHPDTVDEEIGVLSSFNFLQWELLSSLNAQAKTNELFLWDCVTKKYPSELYGTKFGSYAERDLVPDFQSNCFQKCVFFHISVLSRLEDEKSKFSPGDKELTRLVNVFFARELEIFEAGDFEIYAHQTDYKFSSIHELIKTSALLYAEVLRSWVYDEKALWEKYTKLLDALK